MNSILAIIPARSGSKGIPNKNKKCFAGVPLIEYSLKEAVRIPQIDIVVASDDPDILKIAANYGCDVEYKRPASVSADTTSMYEVVIDVLNFTQKVGRDYKTVLILQPTSPLRRASQIIEALENFQNDPCRALMGVSPMLHHPLECILESTQTGDQIDEKEWDFILPQQKAIRRQEYQGAYWFINGAIYIYDVKKFVQKKLNLNGAQLYKMPIETSIDIDDPFDWALAEAAHKNAKGSKT